MGLLFNNVVTTKEKKKNKASVVITVHSNHDVQHKYVGPVLFGCQCRLTKPTIIVVVMVLVLLGNQRHP